MALGDKIIIVNQTGADATIRDMGDVVIPAGGQDDFSERYPIEFIYRSNDLKFLISSGTLLASDGTYTLPIYESLEYLSFQPEYLGRDATSIRGVGVTDSTSPSLSSQVLKYDQQVGVYGPDELRVNDLKDANIGPTPSSSDLFLFDGTNWVNRSFSGAGFFGADASYAFSNEESGTNATTYVNKINLSTDVLKAGTYRVAYSVEVSHQSSANQTWVRLILDGVTTITEITEQPVAGLYIPAAGFSRVVFASDSTHDFGIDWRSDSVVKTAYIRNAHIEIWRSGGIG